MLACQKTLFALENDVTATRGAWWMPWRRAACSSNLRSYGMRVGPHVSNDEADGERCAAWLQRDLQAHGLAGATENPTF